MSDWDTVDATGYLIIEGTRRRYGDRSVDTAKLVALRVNRPARLDRDQVAVKVTLRIPAAVFDPLTPQALVIVPGSLVDRAPIEVEAVDPNAKEAA